MADKALKFLLSEEAINEVFVDLAVNPDKWYDFALFAKIKKACSDNRLQRFRR